MGRTERSGGGRLLPLSERVFRVLLGLVVVSHTLTLYLGHNVDHV